MKIISRTDAKATGLKRYFTGKPCPHGHVCERYVSSYGCVECGYAAGRSKYKGVKRHRLGCDEIISVINSCKSYSQFRKCYPAEYTTASKRGLLDYARSRLGRGVTSPRWNADSCKDAALKFQTRSDLTKRLPGAYEKIMALGIQDECFAHMDRPVTDADAVYFWGGQIENGSIVAKVGITSQRLGMERINYVSSKYEGPIDFIFLVNCEDARSVEKAILSIGADFHAGDFNGSTEFRMMSWDDVSQAYQAIMKGN